jgi:two-component system sensor histidine kinase MprB
MTLAAALAVSVGIGAGVGFAYVALRSELLENMDSQLAKQAGGVAAYVRHSSVLSKSGKAPPTRKWSGYQRAFGDSVTDTQLVYSDGRTGQLPMASTSGELQLPVTPQDLGIAKGTEPAGYRSVQVQGTDLLLYTVQLTPGEALQVALPMTSLNAELQQLGLDLGLAGAGGIVLAAALGWWVTRTALRPVAQLTEAAERIAAEPRDLARGIELGTRADRDELGRLASSFNAMLAAVQDATVRQRQLVADASHELRTPLTSLRMNAEVLDKFDRLDEVDRKRVIDSLLGGIDELTGLVADTMELARGEEREAALAYLRWDELTRRAVERAEGHWPKIEFQLDLKRCVVLAAADRLERAVGNLVNNAAKFSGGEGVVELRLRADGSLIVRDHGPGIPEDDLPHVFDRFYRSAAMRDRPGSGLGLAIVAQVAESHGGSVTAGNAVPGPGAVFTLALPAVRR